MDHSHSEDQLWGAVEILPQRLYYASLKFFPPQQSENDDDNNSSSDDDGDEQQQQQQHTTSSSKKKKKKKKIHYFSIDNELIYWNFFLDFGPLNLGQFHRFSSILNSKLTSHSDLKDDIIVYYSSAKGTARANAIYLICAWSMMYLGRTLEESYFGFREEFYYPRNKIGNNDSSSEMMMMQERNVNGNTSLPPQLYKRHQQRRRHHQRSSSNASASSSSSSSNGSNDRGSNNRPESPFANIHPLPPFHDASPIICTYDLSVYDCLQGLDKARQLGFFQFGNTPPVPPSTASLRSSVYYSETDERKPYSKPSRTPPTTFNVDEYEYFEQVENGDLNWLVAGKILAFAGPQAKKVITPEGFCMLTPSDYIPYFIKQNVKLVIRLNKKCYDENDFMKVGIHHVEHYYLDGSCPPLNILHDVISDMEQLEDDQAMAVHCKAGLGRTGTCIGAYLMKHYRLTAREVIGWMRICRPGMVIGPQQYFLADIEGLMWQEGEVFRGNGLRNMSIVGNIMDDGDEVELDEVEDDDDDGDKKMAAVATGYAATTVVSPTMSAPALTTPSANKSSGVALVTPEGQPIHIPTTPVVARKLDAVDTSMEGISSPPIPSSTVVMKEGDQANALLSARRLAQSQARHSSKSE